MSCDIGLYGLAVMGQNFALNMASHGFTVAVCNRSPSKVDTTVQRAKDEGDLPLIGTKSPEEFISKLSKPRKVVILVQAGKPVDLTIEAISEFMEEGDVIIDGGNEWFPNQIRRHEELEKKGIMFIGMGISGGEEGARNGPSLMPGGPRKAYDLIEPIIMKCAAKAGDPEEPCTGYCGPIGAGNYVKMVHNGIEYGDMQLIGEVYDILKNIVGMGNDEMATLFEDWNSGDLESYLIEITAKILARKDDLTDDGYVVDKILDKTGMKGTGRWTVQEAAEQSVAAPLIAASLDSRYISGRKEERVAASKVLQGPSNEMPQVDKDQILSDLQQALYCAKVTSYAQGMGIIQAASDKNEWDVDLSLCAKMWRGGCIIRASLLSKITAAFEKNKDLQNLLVDETFAEEINARQMAWRRVVSLGVASGIATPALSAALSYFDQYRRDRLPANLIQAQRDFFGGHTYNRVDRDGTFHCLWDETHKDIGDLTGRTAGEL
ncbi:6-phosphogluconate dehydrogenase [Phaeodactylum tricornutum CCAP 1055/1]|jgi:6-phosphogluconate dehydrogenase|nr:6-phosphogluconate dehydrogenase [Phaeodactylum tricornutum CCAP 1055/1]EEC49349.1 6-phosphogluconate dehydrogenase [Phaeodactylum tricornutum CCAP 1055/1]|eukprot:XP_002179526.1 6-phosphogluconate dehydrogenase [Phaeodactylum tricornutum CCAP 1055/1]